MINLKASKFTALVFAIALSLTSIAMAKPYTGTALIENGDVAKAKQNARNEAMRAFVESECGVKINSDSVMENFIVVRDKIVSHSEGYVAVKKVISEDVKGEYVTIVLDLEASNVPIKIAAQDIANQIKAAAENSSRTGLDIALMGATPKESTYWSNRAVEGLREEGYQPYVADKILEYLERTPSSSVSLVELRNKGREAYSGARALIRGRISLARPGELVGPKIYRAYADISCDIIGYESNRVDAVSYTASAVADSKEMAERRAKEEALAVACKKLAKQTSETLILETRGGNMNIKELFTFTGISNRAAERKIILDSISSIGCRSLRSGFTPDGSFQVFIASESFPSIEELKNELLSVLASNYPNSSEAFSEDSGSVKYIINLG